MFKNQGNRKELVTWLNYDVEFCFFLFKYVVFFLCRSPKKYPTQKQINVVFVNMLYALSLARSWFHVTHVQFKVVEQHFSECSVDSTQMGRLAFTDQISYDYARICYTYKRKCALTSMRLTFHHSIKWLHSIQFHSVSANVEMNSS